MRLGIVPARDPSAGGIYQYSATVLDVLLEHRAGLDDDDELVVVHDRDALLPERELALRGCPRVELPSFRSRAEHTRLALAKIPGGGRLSRVPTRMARRVRRPRDPLAPRLRSDIEAWFDALGLDLLLYPAPRVLSFQAGRPFVIAVHDLQHRLQPDLPEFTAPGLEWENWEFLYRNAIAKATIVLTDSDVGKQDVLSFYGSLISEERIHVVPFVPPPYIAAEIGAEEKQRVVAAHGLPDDFLFYPAQFWPHKNHLRIIEAVGELKRAKGVEVHFAFTHIPVSGLRRKRFRAVMEQARRLGVLDQLHCLGYVDALDMAPLYAASRGLVMPTLFGPTNIPVVEAWSTGCPVLTSDLRGIREQAGDAALLVDPLSTEAIADGIEQLWTRDGLRAELAQRGRARLNAYTIDDFSTRLAAAIDCARDIVVPAQRSRAA